MKYRDVEYTITAGEAAWMWVVSQRGRTIQSGHVKGPKLWAIQTAKATIDEMADAEVRKIEARLKHLDFCLDTIKQFRSEDGAECD